MNQDTEKRSEFRLPGENAGGTSGDDLRPWSPPEVRVLPLVMTGGQDLSAGNEHTPSSFISEIRMAPEPES